MEKIKIEIPGPKTPATPFPSPWMLVVDVEHKKYLCVFTKAFDCIGSNTSKKRWRMLNTVYRKS